MRHARVGHSLASALAAEKNASTDLSIIVPTYPLHFRKAVDLVRSVRLNVRSARRVLTLLVVSAINEKPALRRLLKEHDALYWWVHVASLYDVSECAAEASGDAALLAANATQFRHAPLQGFDKYVLQASKKTLGALCVGATVGARHALLLDSESLVVRRVDLEREVMPPLTLHHPPTFSEPPPWVLLPPAPHHPQPTLSPIHAHTVHTTHHQVRALDASVRPILFDAPSAGSGARQNGGATTRGASARLVERVLARACADGTAGGTASCAPRWDASPTTGRMYGFSLGYFWLFPTALVRGFVENKARPGAALSA